ncbi:MAG: hypothetical protein HQK96_13270 [Nitrospirae bacterium]|nr:hypothetical protein [Nitrospirota bacterium]
MLQKYHPLSVLHAIETCYNINNALSPEDQSITIESAIDIIKSFKNQETAEIFLKELIEAEYLTINPKEKQPKIRIGTTFVYHFRYLQLLAKDKQGNIHK